MKFVVLTASLVFAFAICDLRFAIGGVTTQPATTQPSAEIRQCFADLASRDADKREDARIKLMGLKRDDLRALATLVGQSRPLAAAQAAALQEIVTHVFLAGEQVLSE